MGCHGNGAISHISNSFFLGTYFAFRWSGKELTSWLFSLMVSFCSLNCLCSFPVWCLGKYVELDCIGSWPLPLLCSRAYRIESYPVTELRSQVFSWRGTLITGTNRRNRTTHYQWIKKHSEFYIHFYEFCNEGSSNIFYDREKYSIEDINTYPERTSCMVSFSS